MTEKRLEPGRVYYCSYCSKPARHKRVFGTLHVCLLPEHRQAIDNAKIAEQQRVALGGLDALMRGPYPSIFTDTRDKG
jgi:hypothetical protein